MKERVRQQEMIMASLPMPAWSAPVPAAKPAPRRAAFARPSKPAAAPATLTALEWSIVAMAQKDRVSSLREPSRFLAALGSVFGERRPKRLANDRLEMLRRLAVYAWHYHWNVPDSELRAFLAAGFSMDHYELIQASINRARSSAAQNRRLAR
jgi:hypothetical protein